MKLLSTYYYLVAQPFAAISALFQLLIDSIHIPKVDLSTACKMIPFNKKVSGTNQNTYCIDQGFLNYGL